MHNNRFWLAFLAVFTSTVLIYSGFVATRIFFYQIQNQEVAPKTLDWSIEPQSSDRFSIQGKYTFLFNEKTFEGETTFQRPVLVNRSAAEQGIKNFQGRYWTVWFAKKNPSISTLDRTFPTKTLAYGITLWGILLYFIWLGFYVRRKYHA